MGCSHVVKTAAASSAAVDNSTGASSYKPVITGDEKQYTVQPGQSFSKPLLEKTFAPVYPPNLVPQKLPPLDLMAQVIVDEQGHVSDVRVQHDATTPDAEQAAFAQAVQQAAMRWQFSPLLMTETRIDAQGHPVSSSKGKPFSLAYAKDARVRYRVAGLATASTPLSTEVAMHRHFSVPHLDYPFGTVRKHWLLQLMLHVDTHGRVACVGVQANPSSDFKPDDQERALLSALGTWRYTPFRRDGHPVEADVFEWVVEQELPGGHQPLPQVALSDVHLHLKRTECYGMCPAYSLDMYGDGRVVWRGVGYVDLVGELSYRIPAAKMAELVATLQENDLWSMRKRYRAEVTDYPTIRLAISMGKKTHRIEDYAGEMVGIPIAVAAFEQRMDAAAGVEHLIHLDPIGMQRLHEQHFHFKSAQAGLLLAYSVADAGNHHEALMLDLIRKGAPLSACEPLSYMPGCVNLPVLVSAIYKQRQRLIDPLLQRGALQTDGKPDQQKIDEAYLAAFDARQPLTITRIWQAAGDAHRPRLIGKRRN
uniref:DUF6438 domain-containing protein n=1 Tax=Mycena chlorophos TaxID=658473 RepID=A0ABQ0KVW0_MYCCL|nr:predicted protein [Mycena chlorophos]